MSATVASQPKWASMPGESIRAILDRNSASVEDLADMLGLSDPDSRRLIAGEIRIDAELANRLSRALGGSPEFWLEREGQFRESLHWVSADRLTSSLPVRELTEFGWVADTKDWLTRASTVLDFFGVASATEWNAHWGHLVETSNFRASPSFASPTPVVAAWLRQVQIVTSSIELAQWSPAAFKLACAKARALTRVADPAIFLPELQALCASAGVAIAVVRAPTGCAVSGASFREEGRRIIGLSARHLTDDHFWFTFFHEAAHVLLHLEDELFLDEFDEGQPDSAVEREADEHALSIILDGTSLGLQQGKAPRSREILAFASRIGIAPGLVVGTLQHSGAIPWNRLNFLKRRYRWAGTTLGT